MAPPLTTRNIGDTIGPEDYNDVTDYIEDGTYRINTLALEIDGTEFISSARSIHNVTKIDGYGKIYVGTTEPSDPDIGDMWLYTE